MPNDDKTLVSYVLVMVFQSLKLTGKHKKLNVHDSSCTCEHLLILHPEKLLLTFIVLWLDISMIYLLGRKLKLLSFC